MKHLKPISKYFCIGGLVVFLFNFQLLKAQNDTIFSGNDTIPCRVRELGLRSIIYTIHGTESPKFEIYFENVNAYRIEGRQMVIIAPNSNFKEQSKEWLTKNALVLKTNPFAPLNNHFTLGVEQSISNLLSLEMEGAYIDSKGFIQTNRYNHGLRSLEGMPVYFNGGYLRPSIKLKKLDYRNQKRINCYFLRLDAVISTLRYHDVLISNGKGLTSDITVKSKGILLSPGYQVCGRSGFVFEMFFSLGYSDFQYDVANKNIVQNTYGYEGMKEYLSDAAPYFYSFLRQGYSGLTYSFGIRLGYRISDR